MNEIVKFTTDAGQLVEVTPDDVRNYLCPNATGKEIAMFLALCQAQRLNPFIKDAYLIKYGDNPATIVTGKDVFVKRASANPSFEGMEHGVVFLGNTPSGPMVQRREGAAVYKVAGEQLLGGWARVYVKDKKPFYCEVSLDEYAAKKKDGSYVKNWAQMPSVMIDKCAQVACLRLAFPDDFQGMYAQEEIKGANVDDPQPMPVQPVQETRTIPVDSDDVVYEPGPEYVADDLMNRVRDFAALTGKPESAVMQALAGSRALKTAGYAGGGSLTQEQIGVAIGLLNHWISKAQERNASAEE